MVTDTWDHPAGSNYARVISDDKVLLVLWPAGLDLNHLRDEQIDRWE